MSALSRFLHQSFFIPAPKFTEDDLSDQKDRVVIITGGYGGVGYELTKLLYKKNATIYIAGRSKDKAIKAIEEITSSFVGSEGKIKFLEVDLSDLSTIKPAVKEFLQFETRLDFLDNNAGVMMPPTGTKSAQGHELQVATNCLGSYLFTKLLTPVLKSTANFSPPNTVRVAWAGSLAIDLGSPKHGIEFDENGDYIQLNDPYGDYSISKTGNLFLAHSFGVKNPEIVSVCYNPGNLRTDLFRHVHSFVQLLFYLYGHPMHLGAYTELYCGYSDEISTTDNGRYIAPWGKKYSVRPDIQLGLKPESSGGAGTSEKFLKWCDKQVKEFE